MAAPAAHLDAYKREVCRRVDAIAPLLVSVSHDVHSHPELALEERYASSRLRSVLANGGMHVEPAAYGVETAFAACVGPRDQPAVVICCEYDALPGLGHACGHNIIAAAGAGAGLALVPLASRLAQRVEVLGTPAEERHGGKVMLIERGAFRGARAVMLVHPATEDVATPALRAALGVDVVFFGVAAHAALAPEYGRNALDAAISAYGALRGVRSALRFDEQVTAVVTTNSVPNVIPERAVMKSMIRAASLERATAIAEQVASVSKHAAAAFGCSASTRRSGTAYDSLVADLPLAHAFAMNAARLGRSMRFGRPHEMARAGSTDLGNVSRVAPTIHPKLAIAPSHAPPHSARFARFATSPSGDRAVIDGAKAMAMTAIDVWCAAPRSEDSFKEAS